LALPQNGHHKLPKTKIAVKGLARTGLGELWIGKRLDFHGIGEMFEYIITECFGNKIKN